jgi:hypothetical protein
LVCFSELRISHCLMLVRIRRQKGFGRATKNHTPLFSRRIQRFGPKGKESFEFEQIEANGDILEFDNARLRINTNRCKIVIVDGQH